MNTILLLEDDESLNKGISLKLRKEGYEVLSACGVTEATTLWEHNNPDLIISDITMEDGNGLEFCRQIRQKSDVYILFLSALDQEVDIVNGYDTGADDYITKPFSLMVLISKVNALMRRSHGEKEAGHVLASEAVRLNCREMKVYGKGGEIFLSKKELQLLCYFMERPGQIVSKEQILEAVWDVDGQFVDDNTVPVTVSRLRAKLREGEPDEALNSENYIKNIRGLGYLWTREVLRK